MGEGVVTMVLSGVERGVGDGVVIGDTVVGEGVVTSTGDGVVGAPVTGKGVVGSRVGENVTA